MFQYIHLLGEDLEDGWRDRTITALVTEFEKLRDRIERKRQEIQGLSDGVKPPIWMLLGIA